MIRSDKKYMVREEWAAGKDAEEAFFNTAEEAKKFVDNEAIVPTRKGERVTITKLDNGKDEGDVIFEINGQQKEGE